MAYRRYSLILILWVLTARCASAQVVSFQHADSTSAALYLSANWAELVDYGNKAIATGIDFPQLRERLGYAEFMSSNFSAALSQYNHVLKSDSFNQTAQYYSYLSERYLNRSLASSGHASFLDTVAQKQENLTPFGLVEAGVETGIKHTDYNTRGNTFYTRASLSNRLGWHVQMDQSLVYFYQSITIPRNNNNDNNTGTVPLVQRADNVIADAQFEYYIKLMASIGSNWNIVSAYHYLNTSYGTDSYNSHVGLLGIRYLNPYFDLQADVNEAKIINKINQQYNATLKVYPLGNLNLYTISRISHQKQDVLQTVFSQTIGFKVVKNFWLEGAATFGKLDNYIDADALYIYNSIDITNFKGGATGFYQLNNHAMIYLNYTFEQKQETNQNISYNQNSITGGFTWKF